MAERGRPSLIDDQDMVNKIYEAVRVGCSYVDAAKAVGIAPSTIRGWVKKGEKPRGKEKYRAFREKLMRARAMGKRELINAVFIARKKDWRAATHLLAVWDSRWCLEKRADEKRITTYILNIAKKTLPRDLYDQLIDAIAEDQEYS